ncbi:MAG: DUF4040 domain-containing protein [Sedimentisphaerales bacterium]|nr:DUF4040 domain-containing protein [Sedimentisphaerales bacterium]
MVNIIIVVLGIIMITSAFKAIYMKSLLSSIIAAGVISLMASIIYLLLAAPDVAMTEAAIGSGLTTVVFLYAFSKVKAGEEDSNG